jgi:hypothetical protein
MANKKAYSDLQPSELAIFSAAANIFSSYIASGKVNDENENDMIKKSIETSIKISDIVDQVVQSDGEVVG